MLLWSSLMRLRPAQIAVLGKRLLQVKRGVLELPSGHRLWIDPASQLGQALLRDQIYEPGTLAILDTFLRSQDTFIDVGANEGYFTVVAARLVSDGTVVAVEPQARLQEVLDTNIKLNDADNVVVRRLALSDNNEGVVLNLRPTTNTGASSIHRVGHFGKKKEVVPTLMLDELLRREGINEVRLIKIDCEGAEEAVINGAQTALNRKVIDYILIDYHPHVGDDGIARSKRVHGRILASGYEWDRVHGADLYRRPQAPVPSESGW
jgi:FkbM family methyltransferase